MMLKEIVGHRQALSLILNAIKRNRVPAALLFSGDSGIGKRLAALTLSKILNCLEPIDSDCCDKCMSCKKIDAGIHPDVRVFLPENDEIKIETIRRIIDDFSLTAFEGKKKVAIIDDADAMNTHAANAFLKTLEEPPPESLIILISSKPDILPDTIKSRCSRIRFHPLSPDDCRAVLARSALAKVSDNILKSAMGRPGMLLARDVAEEQNWFMKLLKDMSAVGSKNAWSDKTETKLWLDTALLYIRDKVIFSIMGERSHVILGIDERDADIRRLLNAYRELDILRGLLDLNLNKSILWNYISLLMKRSLAV